MLREYIDEALKRADYEIIEGKERFYGEIKECPGVWATGKTLEKCRKNLEDVLDGWLYVRISKELDIPQLGNIKIPKLEKAAS
jgi:predicted RNase H-like HicB family nuclease